MIIYFQTQTYYIIAHEERQIIICEDEIVFYIFCVSCNPGG